VEIAKALSREDDNALLLSRWSRSFGRLQLASRLTPLALAFGLEPALRLVRFADDMHWLLDYWLLRKEKAEAQRKSLYKRWPRPESGSRDAKDRGRPLMTVS